MSRLSCSSVPSVPFSLPAGSFVSGSVPRRAPLVAFVGSRSLPGSAAPLVSALVGSVLASGRRVGVGCASGADSLVVSSVLAAAGGRSLSFFCAFGPSGWGALPVSLPLPSVVALVAAGARCLWWAGGGPAVAGGGLPPVRARLAGRSLALVRVAAASPRPGSGLVALVSGPPPRSFAPARPGRWPSCGSGSWSAAGAAALLGLPVLVFPVAWPGFSPAALPALPGAPGAWVPAASSAPWAAGFRWLPA